MADTQDRPVTTRNLVDGDIGPLRRLTGILDSLPTEPQTFGEGESKRSSVAVTVNLKDIEVVEAVEPYAFPIFSSRPLTLSNRKRSRWGVFGDSFNQVADKQYTKEQLDQTNPAYIKPKDRMNITECIGKRIGIVMADGEDGRPQPPLLFDGRQPEKRDGVPTPTWMVYLIEGIGSTGQTTNPLEKAKKLLDGRTLAEFNALAFEDQDIRSSSDVLQSISLPPSARASFSTMEVEAGEFSRDENGVYHRVVK